MPDLLETQTRFSTLDFLHTKKHQMCNFTKNSIHIRTMEFFFLTNCNGNCNENSCVLTFNQRTFILHIVIFTHSYLKFTTFSFNYIGAFRATIIIVILIGAFVYRR